MNHKTETLFGGRLVKVRLLDNSEIEVKVRQLPLGDYERAMLLLDDEIALTALICGQPREWALNLAPDDYELLQATAQEVNGSFFAFSRRRRKREQDAMGANIAALSALPSEAMAEAMGTIQKMALQSVSPTGSPAPRPR